MPSTQVYAHKLNSPKKLVGPSAFRPTGRQPLQSLPSCKKSKTSSYQTNTSPSLRLIFQKRLIRYATMSSRKKITKLTIPDNIYNWLIDNLRKHATKFYGLISKIAEINTSVVQGSGVGLSVCASDLHPHHKENLLCQICR